MIRPPYRLLAALAACLAASATFAQGLPPLPGQLPPPAAPAAPATPPVLPALPGGSALPSLPALPPPPAVAAPREIAPVAATPPSAAAEPAASGGAPARSAGSSPIDQVLANVFMPGIVGPILRKESAALRDGRDVRNYVFSMFSGFASVCGPTNDETALFVIGYVEPDMAPGKNMANAGLKRIEQMIIGLGQVAKSGDIRDAVAFGKAMDGSDKLIREGQADGAVLASLGCGTPLFRDARLDLERMVRSRSGTNALPSDALLFASYMSRGYRESIGIPDPEPQLRRRRIDGFAQQADKLCNGRFEPRAFCACLLTGLRKSDLAEDEWKTLAADFGAVPVVAAKRPDVAAMARVCVRES
jgi:hypothetical protein